MRVGFGKTDVSPPPGGGDMDLRVLGFWDGRALRYGPVHDPLCARAAVFAAGDDAAAAPDGEWAVQMIAIERFAHRGAGNLHGAEFPGKLPQGRGYQNLGHVSKSTPP